MYSLVYGGEALKQALKQSQIGVFHQFGKIAGVDVSLAGINASMSRAVSVFEMMAER
jgi:hypothetical protein